MLAPVFSLLNPQPRRAAAKPVARLSVQLAPIQAAWHAWQLQSLHAFYKACVASQQHATASGQPQTYLLMCRLTLPLADVLP